MVSFLFYYKSLVYGWNLYDYTYNKRFVSMFLINHNLLYDD